MGSQLSFLPFEKIIDESWNLVNGENCDSTDTYDLNDTWLLVKGNSVTEVDGISTYSQQQVHPARLQKVMRMWKISEADALELINTVDLTQDGKEFNQIGPRVRV
jgi:hypothetical protein